MKLINSKIAMSIKCYFNAASGFSKMGFNVMKICQAKYG